MKNSSALRAGDHSLGSVAQRLLPRYFEIVRRHLPRFSTAEWCALVDALKQVPEAWSPSYIFAEVHDTRGPRGEVGD